jgi:hypothetical protein
VTQPTAATWGEEVLAHFARRPLLEGDLLQSRLRVRDDVRLHALSRPTGDGWSAEVLYLQQERGLRWSGGIDTHGAGVLAGCDGSRTLGAQVAVLAGALGMSVEETAEQLLPAVRRLVGQGFLGA